MKLAIVSMQIVFVDCSMLAEMSDGTLVEVKFPYGLPKPYRNNWGGLSQPEHMYRFQPEAKMRELAMLHNSAMRVEQRERVTLRKVSMYGADFASRGY